MTIYDKTRRARSVLRAHELLAPLNPDGSFASERRGPPSPTRKGKEPDFVSFASRSDDDWADELVSTLERVMIATTEKRKANFKSKKGSGPPRRSDLVDVEDRRLWLVSQCYELVKKEREKVVSSRRGIGGFLKRERESLKSF